MKLKHLFKKQEPERKAEEPKVPPKNFHPGRPGFWDLLKINRTIKTPVAKL